MTIDDAIKKILDAIDIKIAIAKKAMVTEPHDELDRIANDTAEAFIVAYEECKDIVKMYLN